MNTESSIAGLGGLEVRGFLEKLGAKVPAPGGGAAACVTGATGAAIAKMVVEYSIGKRNLAAHQGALELAREELIRFQEVFLELADEDAAAYGMVNELSKLAVDDPRRVSEWPAASAAAVAIPRAALAAACDLLRLVETLPGITNRHLRSDLAIAGILGEAAAKSAWWNVSVNLMLLEDAADRSRVQHEGEAACADAAARRGRVERACEG